MPRSRGFAVELALGDVLHDAVGHQVPQRAAFCGAPTAVGRRDRQRRDLDQGQRVIGQPVEHAGEVFAAQLVAGPADPDEPRHREQFLQVLPRQDGRQRVGAGDEVQLGVRVERVQIPQRVLGVGGTAAVDVDPAHREAGVGRGGDHRHQVAVFAGADLAVLLPGLTGRHEDHLVEVEPVGHFAGGDQVAVVDGIERPTHHSQPPLLHGLPAYWRAKLLRSRQLAGSVAGMRSTPASAASSSSDRQQLVDHRRQLLGRPALVHGDHLLVARHRRVTAAPQVLGLGVEPVRVPAGGHHVRPARWWPDRGSWCARHRAPATSCAARARCGTAR